MSDRRRLGYDLARVGEYGPDRIMVGYDHTGQEIIIDRTWRPNQKVSGEPGSGKGGLVRVELNHDVTVGNQIVVIQPKPGEFGWLEGAATLVSTSAGASRALSWGVKQMNDRQATLEATPNPSTGTVGIDKFDDLPEPWHRIVFYIDEAPAVLGEEAMLGLIEDLERDGCPEEQIPKRAQQALQRRRTTVAAIVKRGRSVGVNLVLMTQYPTVGGTFGGNSTIGGGIFRALTQCCHFDRDTESLKAAFTHAGKGTPKVLRKIEDNRPGRMAYCYAQEQDGGSVRAGQVIWLTQEQARQSALAYEGPEPMEFDQ